MRGGMKGAEREREGGGGERERDFTGSTFRTTHGLRVPESMLLLLDHAEVGLATGLSRELQV